MSLTVTESIAVGTLLQALGFNTGRGERPPTEEDVRKAAETLAAAASRRMQLTYLPHGANAKLRLRVRRPRVQKP